jgi:hypothetical protein
MADAHKSRLPLYGVADGIHHSIHDAGFHLTPKPLIILGCVFLAVFLILSPHQMLVNFDVLAYLSPIWVTAFLYTFTYHQFVESRKAAFIAKQDMILLELRMPRDTQKTPLAMETIFATLHLSAGESNRYKTDWNGSVRPWWSLEIVSLGGRVHFYMWTRASFRRTIEAAFYAQYPNMEIIEAEDYSLIFDPLAHENAMFGDEYKHSKDDPYPIKTYIDFGLDKSGMKPEEQIDPLSQIIELLSSLGPKEQFWLQFIIRVSGKEKYKHKLRENPKYNWKDHSKEIITKLRDETVKKTSYVDATGKKVETEGFPNITKGQADTISAIERNVAKQAFDVGIRAIYTAPEEAFQGSMITPQLNLFKAFSSETTNAISTSAKFSAQFNDYPWEDRSGHRLHEARKNIVNYYRRRAYFQAPYAGNYMIMSIEELATLFHVPTASTTSPGLPRIQSKASSSPSNLPI